MERPVYCLDTSTFLDSHQRYYPPEVFPTLWERMNALVTTGRIIAPQDVLLELRKGSDATYEWAQQHQLIFVEVDRFQEAQVREILAQYPRLVSSGRGRNQADPWVIALAKTQGAIVVTGERGGTTTRPRIPFICDQLGVESIQFLEILRREGWSF